MMTPLESWMQSNGKTYRDLAIYLGSEEPVAWRYVKGKRRPRDAKTIERITKFTGGAISALDLLRTQ